MFCCNWFQIEEEEEELLFWTGRDTTQYLFAILFFTSVVFLILIIITASQCPTSSYIHILLLPIIHSKIITKIMPIQENSFNYWV